MMSEPISGSCVKSKLELDLLSSLSCIVFCCAAAAAAAVWQTDRQSDNS